MGADRPRDSAAPADLTTLYLHAVARIKCARRRFLLAFLNPSENNPKYRSSDVEGGIHSYSDRTITEDGSTCPDLSDRGTPTWPRTI
jgi:hypothetical protein